jgi:hypothetical protein
LAKAQFTLTNTSSISIMEPRQGQWPMDLQRKIKNKDTVYVLNFRDQQYPQSTNMYELKFSDKVQLKYFQEALTALKGVGNGETAQFKGYSIKRADAADPNNAKKMQVWYILTCDNGSVTNFQQPEADKMIAAIKPL